MEAALVFWTKWLFFATWSLSLATSSLIAIVGAIGIWKLDKGLRRFARDLYLLQRGDHPKNWDKRDKDLGA